MDNRFSVIEACERLIESARAGQVEGCVLIPVNADGRAGVAECSGVAALDIYAAAAAARSLADRLALMDLPGE
ncbi:hypothetical protein [Uliginosibacterium sediminicola]|uniref:Uncharacterized protein n=1 Tax=Uliginosibacterium sediminicola TaxID=2024550 RepID=A0ABU9YW11_9RHOO